METYTKTQIVTAVRKALDENTDTSELSSDENTLELDDIIEAQIENGIDGVRMIAPLSKLEVQHKTFGTEQKPVDKFELPKDFLRLAVIYGKTWKTPVSEFVVPGTTAYLMQSSEFAGIKGSSSRPVAALTEGSWTEEGNVLKVKPTVEVYPKTSGLMSYVGKSKTMTPDGEASETVAAADGVGTPAAETSYSIEGAIYGAVVFYIASLVCSVQANANGMQLMKSLAMEMLGKGN